MTKLNEQKLIAATTTPLGISGVYTSTGIEIKKYGWITGTVFADQASAVNGLSIEQSPDGTNWDYKSQFSISASTGDSFTIEAIGRFVRIVYTNGLAAQTVFRLSASLRAV